MVNGVNSKFLATITRRTIHQEVKYPTIDAVDFVQKRRWEYLGHILRLDDSRTLKKCLLSLSPSEAPFGEGSLLAHSSFKTQQEAIAAAQDRRDWKGRRKRGREEDGDGEE